MEVQQDMGAMQAEIRLHQDIVAQVMLGQVKVEIAVVIRSLGPRVRDLRPGVPPSLHTCVEGEESFCGGRGENNCCWAERATTSDSTVGPHEICMVMLPNYLIACS